MSCGWCTGAASFLTLLRTVEAPPGSGKSLCNLYAEHRELTLAPTPSYNCKSPEHESNACPEPRTAESKQCFGCG